MYEKVVGGLSTYLTPVEPLRAGERLLTGTLGALKECICPKVAVGDWGSSRAKDRIQSVGVV